MVIVMLTKRNITYPFYSKTILPVVGTILALSITLQYALALFPTILALVPLAIALGIGCLVSGLLTQILISPPKDILHCSFRSVAKQGVQSGIITLGLLVIPSALLISVVLLPADGMSDTGGLLFVISSTAAVLLFLAAAYLLPITVVLVSQQGIAGVASDSSAIIIMSRELDYLTAWVVGFSVVGIGLAPLAYSVTAGDIFGVLAAVMASYLLIFGVLIISSGIPHNIVARSS